LKLKKKKKKKRTKERAQPSHPQLAFLGTKPLCKLKGFLTCSFETFWSTTMVQWGVEVNTNLTKILKLMIAYDTNLAKDHAENGQRRADADPFPQMPQCDSYRVLCVSVPLSLVVL
jgi:hypothetical protein